MKEVKGQRERQRRPVKQGEIMPLEYRNSEM